MEAPLSCDIALFGKKVNDRIWGCQIKFGAVGFIQSADIPGIFHDGHLHPETNSEIGNIVFPGILNRAESCLQCRGCRNRREPERHPHPIKWFCRPSCFNFFGIDKFQFHAAIIGDAAVHQRLIQTFVGIGQVDIFADNADAYFIDAD